MDSSRWKQIQDLFHRAADLPIGEQRTFLNSACGDDQALAGEVLALLAEDSRGHSILDRELSQVAHEMLDPGPAPTKQVGPYSLIRLLGEGGMGVVYLASRPDLGNRVAIKILRDAWLSPARRERFASEQRTLAQLNHPSIARLYDSDSTTDGIPWFVMEYVEGVPLTDYCRRSHCSIHQRLQIFRAVCEAVRYAHQHAVIHRDLKPSNILVRPDGTVKLLDFGIAKQLESLEGSVEQTMTGLRLMTPAYAAPEQIRGERIGVHTDVYSLGVILYELLAGRLPFDLSTLTPAEAAAVLTTQGVTKPSLIAQAGPKAKEDVLSKTAWADLDVICLTAMHKDPERRYRSVETLIRDIDHYLNSEPLEARPDSLRYRADKFIQRNRKAVLAAAMTVLLVASLVIFFSIRLARERRAELEEAARAQRVQRFMLNLFQGGDEAAGPSDDLRVITLLDRGVVEAQSLSSTPEAQAELYATLGSIYEKLGHLDRADSLLNQALEERKKVFGPRSRQAAESLIALGMLRSDQARLDNAEQLVRQGLEIDRRELNPEDPTLGKATSALGTILENRGEYDQAIPVLNQAAQLQSAPSASPADLAVTLSELANTEFYAGHLDVSDSLNHRVLELDRRLYGDRHPHVSDDLINLAAIQFEEGHYSDAENYQRQALDIIEGFYGKDHPETASAMTLLARTLVNEKRLDEASEMMHGVLAIQERVYGKVHPRVASALNELGRIAQQQGNLAAAESDFQRMAEIYTTVYAGKHYYIAVALSNLAGVYIDEKQYAKGEALFRQALQMYAQTLPPDHQLVAIAHIRLGRGLLRQGRYTDAAAESRAGFELLKKQSTPPAYWVNVCRTDLAQEYEALKRPQEAAEFRAALTAADK